MNPSRRTLSILDSYEQLALLKQPNPRAPTGLRNLCIISLMLRIGLRVNEAVNLQVKEIDWEEGRIRIASSGAAKERILSIDKPELSLLKKWREQKPPASEYFFCTLDGSKLQDRYIREMIKRLAKKAGIEKDVYPHLLRYTFAVEFVRETGDINLLQEALGHRDAAATHNYAKHLFAHLNYNNNADNFTRRSGMPFNADDQQLNFWHIGNNAETGKSIAPKEEALDINKPRTAVITENADPGSKQATGNDAESSKMMDIDIKPRIGLDEELLESDSRTPIPPIKCSSCNYILRYKGDCPKCGVSFENIMAHWRKNV